MLWTSISRTLVLVPLCTVSISADTVAQWLPSGNDIYFDAGHVGIGTPAPYVGSMLHVRSFVEKYTVYANAYGAKSPAYAVFGRGDGSSASGVLGMTTAADSTGCGVRGSAGSAAAIGVRGDNRSDEPGAIGVLGTTILGVGVQGEASGTSGGVGVKGIASSPAPAVMGISTAMGGQGVHGFAKGTSGVGVWGHGPGKAGRGAVGVGAQAGVQGFGWTGSVAGVVGTHNGSGYGVFAEGGLGATGIKSFVQPHPADAATNIRFVCLEGNESGTYFRGTMQLRGGRAEIPIPEDWQLVSEDTGITVQVTPIRSLARIGIWEKSRERIVVVGDDDCTFDYFVNGVRRGFADVPLRTDNRAFRPTVRGVPFGQQYPPAVRQILVDNGTLNPDFTPNEHTAARLGWSLRDPASVPPAERYWVSPDERNRAMR